MRIDEETRSSTQAETDLCTSFIAHYIAEASGDLPSLDVPAISPEVSMNEAHDVDCTQDLRTHHKIVLTKNITHLLFPSRFAGKHHRLGDRAFGFTCANDVDMMLLFSEPSTDVVWSFFAMQVPDPAENAHHCTGHRGNLRQLVTPTVRTAKPMPSVGSGLPAWLLGSRGRSISLRANASWESGQGRLCSFCSARRCRLWSARLCRLRSTHQLPVR
mmetsp:Transcript_83962/g.148172  ORF Transcript_83962/g.148172 Transcript_83962/m.148172 type:complete len:216 (-) Transcript_83962:87-734(-)